MQRHRLPAIKRFASQLTVLLGFLVLPQLVLAQSVDPFALPAAASIADVAIQDGPGLSTVVIDNNLGNALVDLAWEGDVLTIDASSARDAGLPVPEDFSGYVPVKNLHVASWEFSRLNQTLIVKLFRNGDGPNDINFAHEQRRAEKFDPMLALLIDYDITATHDKRDTLAAGALYPRFAKGNFLVGSSLQFTTSPAKNYNAITRLDSSVTIAYPETGLVVKGGDYISAGETTQRSLRFAGLQVASDFALRPDLITHPLPAFDGQVSVPTGVDLVVNDKRFTAGELEAGSFNVKNVPVNPGRGEVSVILRDALGREQIETTRLYVSRELLAKGLWQGGINAGFLRKNYGRLSNDYRDFGASFILRHGMNPNVTVGISGEAGLGVANLGASTEFTVGGIALISAQARWSHSNDGTGALMQFGIESMGERVSGKFEVIHPTHRYRDIAAAAGDNFLPSQINAMVNFRLQPQTNVQLTASRLTRPYDPRYPRLESSINMLRANARTPLNQRIDVYADAAYRKGDRRDFSVLAGIMVQLGNRAQAMSSATRSRDNTTVQATYSRPDITPGEVGYGVQAVHSNVDRLAGSVAYRSRFSRVEGQAELVDGSGAVRIGTRGTLVATGGTVYARNQTGGAYAFVKTGDIGGVTVTRENRLAGVSDAQGRMLVEEITPLVPTQFDIDPDKLPQDAIAKSTYQRVSISRGGVGRVEIDIRGYRSIPIRVIDNSGAPLPLGLVLRAESGNSYMVGYDGLIDFNGLSGDQLLKSDRSDTTCSVIMPQDMPSRTAITQITANCSHRVIASVQP